MSHLPKNYVQVHRDKVNQDPTLRALYLEKKKEENKLAA